MKRLPVIGIAGELITETIPPVIGFQYEYTRNNYARAIELSGGIPCYLPVTSSPDVAREQIRLCDGMLIPGGLDVNPLIYNEQPLPLLEATIPRTDRFQLTLIDEALKLGIPILGSCRGNQILNVAFGGTLYQDVSYATPNPLQHSQLTQLDNPAHSITIFEDTILYDLFGRNLDVNTFHHQSINQVGEGLKVTAVAPDGIIEGIQLVDHRFVVGVQWHPEMLIDAESTMLPLFKRFIKASSSSLCNY